jgi:hypothetical protein
MNEKDLGCYLVSGRVDGSNDAGDAAANEKAISKLLAALIRLRVGLRDVANRPRTHRAIELRCL